jgi:hypothetical protein
MLFSTGGILRLFRDVLASFAVFLEVIMPLPLRFAARQVVRTSFLTFVLLLSVSTIQAYTVVLRSGRVVEIPAAFTVTATSLIYEVGSGIQVSLQLVAVDVSATERANREPAGSLLRRIQQKSISPAATPENVPNRSITNRDLERFARARKESEAAYERRRKELGLPTLEESRIQAANEASANRERFEQTQVQERTNEAYWRDRAIELKSDLAATDAEINSLQQQLDWLPYPNSLAGVTVIPRSIPFGSFGRSVVGPAFRTPMQRPGVFVAPNRGPGLSRRNTVGPARAFNPRGINPFRSPFRPGFVAPFAFRPSFTPFVDPSQFYDVSYMRTELLARLNALVGQRAALMARWRALEDEARRAGALPGWLRP